MSSTMSEIARAMVAQGRLTQERYDKLFGMKDAVKGGGVVGDVPAGGTKPEGEKGAKLPEADTAPMPGGSEPGPSPCARGGKDAASGQEDRIEDHAAEFDEPY